MGITKDNLTVIILTLKRMGVHEITLSNRTKSKAEEIKKVLGNEEKSRKILPDYY